jgi:sugar lactone lactonase YvrE
MMLGLAFLATSLILISSLASNLLFISNNLSFSTQQAALIVADSYRGITTGFPCERALNFASQLDLNLVSCRIVNGVAEVELDKTHGFFRLSYKAFAE